MNNQVVIFYQFTVFFKIMKELEFDLNLKVIEVLDHDTLQNKIEESENYIIVSNKKDLPYLNQFFLDKFPVNIFKFIEKLNIKFLKIKYSDQSQIVVKDYLINLNSREISQKNKKLKLTEKEIKIIIYLSKASKSININELQNKVWGYQSDLETHTVETHIYRLRKKFYNFFKDDKFILSDKDGYKIE